MGQRGPSLGAMTGGPVLVVLAAGRAKRYGGCKPLAPVGAGGEAVIDLVAGDAVRGGFGTVVLVINPDTGPSIRYRVERSWPPEVDVRFAVQQRPLGTVHAVLAASDHLVEGAPYGVANADDIYGATPFATLAQHLISTENENALVGFRLRNSVVSDTPVTRGICRVVDGWLRGIDERRGVRPDGHGAFVADDGREPSRLDPNELVSVNLWGFTPAMHKVLEAAMAAAEHAHEGGEVLLPEVIDGLLASQAAASGSDARFRVLMADSRCIGVTHQADLELVQAELTRQVASGDRPPTPWDGLASSLAGPSPVPKGRQAVH